MDACWQVQEAKQRFSEVIREAQASGPQFVTRHGHEVVVILDIGEYHKLTGRTPDLKQHLLDRGATADLDIARPHDLGREVDLPTAT
ncbi:MAG TPA: type II toxin-antitoxin system Phd/YefM family antitoxin [Jatrophihabitantaceae bacterium]|jgi:prevent-host-death family protein|nr:type II toxin-antitoxin system Phd/YefM family antitoxin [Jatrophihabitantaceae bacterium]